MANIFGADVGVWDRQPESGQGVPFDNPPEGPAPSDDVRLLPREVSVPGLSADQLAAHGSPIRQAQAILQHAATTFGEFTEAVHQQAHRFTAADHEAQVRAFARTDAAQAVDRAVDIANERRDLAAAKVESVRRALTTPGDTAAELRATRFWNRTQRLLDSADGGAAVSGKAAELIKAATQDEIGVLAEELVPYLQSRNAPLTDVEIALADAAPGLGIAREQLFAAEQAVMTINASAGLLKAALETQGRPPTMLPDATPYDPDAVTSVNYRYLN